jgi:hypothetical protein
MSGDSLAREHFQNLIGLLTNDGMLMRKVLLSMSFDIPLPVDSAARSVKISFSPDGEVDNPYVDKNTWFLWDVPLMRYLSSGNFIAEAFLAARYTFVCVVFVKHLFSFSKVRTLTILCFCTDQERTSLRIYHV